MATKKLIFKNKKSLVYKDSRIEKERKFNAFLKSIDKTILSFARRFSTSYYAYDKDDFAQEGRLAAWVAFTTYEYREGGPTLEAYALTAAKLRMQTYRTRLLAERRSPLKVSKKSNLVLEGYGLNEDYE